MVTPLRSLSFLYLALLSRSYTQGSVVTTHASLQKVSALMPLRTALSELEGSCPPAYISPWQSWTLLMPHEGLSAAAVTHTYQLCGRDQSNPQPKSWNHTTRGAQNWFPFHLLKQESFTSVCMIKGMKNTTLHVSSTCFSTTCSTSPCWALCPKRLPLLHVKGVELEGKKSAIATKEV